MAELDKAVISDLLENNKRSQVRDLIKDSQSHELALVIDQLTDKEKMEFSLIIPTKMLSEVLLDVSHHSRKWILKCLKDKYIISAIKDADSDDSADILSEVPKHKARRIIDHLPTEQKETIKSLIGYDSDTAGGLMQSELVIIGSGGTVMDAIKELRRQDASGVNYVYVVDVNGKLKGLLSMHKILTAQSDAKIVQIMQKDIVTLHPDMHKEAVAEVFKNTDIFALPVVDKKGKLLGRVTIDDVLDVMEEAATEDMYKIAGLHPDENIFDPLMSSMKRRLPWLVINLGTAIIAALTVSIFSDTLKVAVILAVFMPIMAGMGGNAGTQTLTVVVRSLALNQLKTNNYKKALLKETTLGMINGLTTGLVMAIIAYLWTGKIMLGVAILLAMIINLTVAGLTGISVPLLLKSRKIDPAVASSIFITTFTDVVGFASFLGIATLLIKWIV